LEEWEVRFYFADGRLLRILRAPNSRTPVTPEIRAARRAALEGLASKFRLPVGKGTKVDDEMSVPDSLPAISTLMWDVQDRLWLGHREADPGKNERYDVFDLAGHWLSTVHLPGDIGRILEDGADHLLTGWSDELGVGYVRLYRLERSSQ
jgi:hypothetical protein